MDKILVLNSGSTSVKFQLFEMDQGKHQVLTRGLVERIGQEGSKITLKAGEENTISLEKPIKNHKDAIKAILDYLLERFLKNTSELAAVGHRMGVGGEYFDRSVIIDDYVMEKIYETIPLIPLHGPAFVHGINAISELVPGVIQVATFDTAFHQSMNKSAYMYAIPREYYEKEGVRRFGYHGTSHHYLTRKTAKILGHKGKFICCHLGGGVSITAVKDGKSVDTTMGYSPTAGIMMMTRSGDMDPYIPLHIMKTQSKTVDEVNKILTKESGFYGLTDGKSDMRDIIEHAENGDEKCAFAIDLFVYNIVKAIGAYVAILGGIDALVFTAGIGENVPLIRQKVCERLAFLGIKLDDNANHQHPAPEFISTEDSKVKVLVVHANEELMIATETFEILEDLTANESVAV